MDRLWTGSQNFMQIIQCPEFQAAITKLNQVGLQEQSIETNIDDLYTSPQNKKAIRQVLLVVADIQKAMHGVAPSWLFIEVAKGADRRPKRTYSRQDQLIEVYENSAKDIIDVAVKEKLLTAVEDKRDFTDRLVLYFQQNGQDIYGKKEKLDFDHLEAYHIDHIIPRSVVKDDSLDNRVLTSSHHNEEKGNHVALPVFGSQRGHWYALQRAGLISQRKLRHLLTQPEDLDERATGFVARQLVETRQVIKLVTEILSQQYDPEKTKLVSIKAGLSHQFRQMLDLPKLRDLNDYHHAHDAYLAARIGTYLLQQYPQLERFFVYGKFQTSRFDLRRHYNFIGDMLHGKPDDQIIIKSKKTQMVTWDKQAERAYVEHLMSFKHLLVVHEVYDNHGALFDQTIYPAKNPKGKKLISRKLTQPTNLYGGFSGEKTGYLALIRIKKSQQISYRVMRVPVRLVGKLQRENNERQIEILTDWFQPSMVSRGKAITFEVVSPHIYEEQTIRDVVYGQLHRFSLGTDTYYHNQQQLILSLEAQRHLVAYAPSNKELIAVYHEICRQAEAYFPLYKMNKFLIKLLAGEARFKKLPIQDTKLDNGKVELGQKSVLLRVLQGLHANAGITNLSMIGCPKYFGQLQVPNGIKLTDQAELIYESPTGLFQRRLRLSDL